MLLHGDAYMDFHCQWLISNTNIRRGQSPKIPRVVILLGPVRTSVLGSYEKQERSLSMRFTFALLLKAHWNWKTGNNLMFVGYNGQDVCELNPELLHGKGLGHELKSVDCHCFAEEVFR